MKQIIFFGTLFFLVGCSTPELHIPSYNFGDEANQTSAQMATTKVASIEDADEVEEESSPTNHSIEKSSTNGNIPVLEKEDNTPEATQVEEVEKQPLTEDPKKVKETVKIEKKGGFFSLFGKQPKVKNEYFTGGQIRSKLVMDDDTGESGLLYRYGYDGKVTSTVHIKHGLRHGLETLFNSKGHVMKRTPYVNGQKDGIVEVYYSDGKVLAQITYRNNKRHGRASKYNHDGTTNEEVIYDNGRITENSTSSDIEIPVID